MSGKPIELHDDLIPLPVAARVVYARIYEEKLARPAESFLLQRLDGAAAAIAGITSLYTYEPAQSSAIRRLNVSELRGGTFRNGGNELHYQDGRETLRDLAVARNDLEHVLALLEESPIAAPRTGGHTDDRSVST